MAAFKKRLEQEIDRFLVGTRKLVLVIETLRNLAPADRGRSYVCESLSFDPENCRKAG